MKPEVLLLLGVVIVTTGQHMANMRTTVLNGEGGVVCGEGCNTCLWGFADCVNGTCECKLKKKLVQGDGNFYCYRKNKRFGEIRNDPLITSFDGNHYDLAIPCRYLLMHTRSELRLRKEIHGHCDCQVYGWNKKHKGKLYPAGVDVACNMSVDSDPTPYMASIRVEGEAKDKEYTFREWGSSSYSPNGPWLDGPQKVEIYKNGLQIANMQTVYREENNFAEIDIKSCGVQVAFRPYDVELGKDQCQQNGITFAINCASDPQFFDEDKMVVSAGTVAHGQIELEDNIVDGLTAMQSFLFRAMTTDVIQNQPDAAEECTTVQHVAGQCDTRMKRVNALGRCVWLLKEPRFIKCVDASNNANSVMKLFRRCFEVACTPVGSVEASCAGYLDDIRATGCTHIRGLPALNTVLDPNYCANFWQN